MEYLLKLIFTESNETRPVETTSVETKSAETFNMNQFLEDPYEIGEIGEISEICGVKIELIKNDSSSVERIEDEWSEIDKSECDPDCDPGCEGTEDNKKVSGLIFSSFLDTK